MKKLVCGLFVASALLSAQSLSLAPSVWNLSTNSGKGAKLYTCNAGLCFDFPVQKNKTVNYLFTAFEIPQPLLGSLSVSLRMVTTGNPIFIGTDTCTFPANFRLYFEADSSVWTNVDGDTFRWWSNPIAYQLAAGSTILTVPLTPDQWSTVYGRFGNTDTASLTGFQASVQNPVLLGGTFGAGCNFGHGVSVSGGTAQFQLLNYSTF